MGCPFVINLIIQDSPKSRRPLLFPQQYSRIYTEILALLLFVTAELNQVRSTPSDEKHK